MVNNTVCKDTKYIQQSAISYFDNDVNSGECTLLHEKCFIILFFLLKNLLI